mmetsp:Transcript_55750/g.174638  ORF Transcript_55750/g.174638 Transcript_55750/m.174638 type:complete len:230 (+) Transcript_55750:2740-3429(+)
MSNCAAAMVVRTMTCERSSSNCSNAASAFLAASIASSGASYLSCVPARASQALPSPFASPASWKSATAALAASGASEGWSSIVWALTMERCNMPSIFLSSTAWNSAKDSFRRRRASSGRPSSRCTSAVAKSIEPWARLSPEALKPSNSWVAMSIASEAWPFRRVAPITTRRASAAPFESFCCRNSARASLAAFSASSASCSLRCPSATQYSMAASRVTRSTVSSSDTPL